MSYTVFYIVQSSGAYEQLGEAIEGEGDVFPKQSSPVLLASELLGELVRKAGSQNPHFQIPEWQRNSHVGRVRNGFYPWQKDRRSDNWSKERWVKESRNTKNHKMTYVAHETA